MRMAQPRPRQRQSSGVFALGEQSEQPEAHDGLVVRAEIGRREDRLARLAQAKVVLEARAQERTAAEQAEYEAKLGQRAERERTTGRRPGGRHRPHRCQDRATATSTTSLTRSRAS